MVWIEAVNNKQWAWDETWIHMWTKTVLKRSEGTRGTERDSCEICCLQKDLYVCAGLWVLVRRFCLWGSNLDCQAKNLREMCNVLWGTQSCVSTYLPESEQDYTAKDTSKSQPKSVLVQCATRACKRESARVAAKGGRQRQPSSSRRRDAVRQCHA